MGSRCDTEEGHVLVLVLTEIILPYMLSVTVTVTLSTYTTTYYHIPAAYYYLPWGSGRAHLTPELIY